MWEPRRLTILRAFTACYRDSFTCACSLLSSLAGNTTPHVSHSWVHFFPPPPKKEIAAWKVHSSVSYSMCCHCKNQTGCWHPSCGSVLLVPFSDFWLVFLTRTSEMSAIKPTSTHCYYPEIGPTMFCNLVQLLLSRIPSILCRCKRLKAVEAHRVVTRRGSHIFSTLCSQMAVSLWTLRASRFLPPGRFLVLISARGWVEPGP
jgi:hypothetical protein